MFEGHLHEIFSNCLFVITYELVINFLLWFDRNLSLILNFLWHPLENDGLDPQEGGPGELGSKCGFKQLCP